jgi:hypothetical protein
MDWRHVSELIEAGRSVFTELKNICVWVKTNAGQGSFYRSQHEFVLVFKSGGEPHINTFELGQHGRTRTNGRYADIGIMGIMPCAGLCRVGGPRPAGRRVPPARHVGIIRALRERREAGRPVDSGRA